MTSLRNALCAMAVVGLLFPISDAEARFGKRSRSSDDDKVHDASSARRSSQSSNDDDDDDDDDYTSSYSSSSTVSDTADALLNLASLLQNLADLESSSRQPNTVAELPAEDGTASPSIEVHTSRTPAFLTLRFGGEGGFMGGGTSANLFLSMEGENAGIDVRGTRLTLPTDDGTMGEDRIDLPTLHLTYAVVARDNLRVRIEGGLGGAIAPDMSLMVPSVGASMEGCLLSALDAEARVHTVFIEYSQVDVQAGLALRAKALVLRGGWRAIYLNDRGQVDGVEHEDFFTGPYVGLGLTF